jgi:hypothetical protein
MDTTTIIQAIDLEIARLQQAKAVLGGSIPAAAKPSIATTFKFGTNGAGAGAPAPRKRRRLSAQARARIAAAQKLRWARVRAAKK